MNLLENKYKGIVVIDEKYPETGALGYLSRETFFNTSFFGEMEKNGLIDREGKINNTINAKEYNQVIYIFLLNFTRKM